VLVSPGTRVDSIAPPGWTHLVVKSIPRIATGDIDSLGETGRTTAVMFRSVILAETGRSAKPGGGFVLRRVGVGVCVPDRGHDTVVTTQSLDKLGIDLSTIPRIVLDRMEKELQQGQVVARTSTFALLRAPVLILVGSEHRRLLLNYAYTVDTKTGDLKTAAWTIEPEPGDRRAPREFEVLSPPPLVYNCDLDVATRRLFGEIPVSFSIAIRALPPGKMFPVPPTLQTWSIRDLTSQDQAAVVEAAVRAAIR
jgi:hypothetical protein